MIPFLAHAAMKQETLPLIVNQNLHREVIAYAETAGTVLSVAVRLN